MNSRHEEPRRKPRYLCCTLVYIEEWEALLLLFLPFLLFLLLFFISSVFSSPFPPSPSCFIETKNQRIDRFFMYERKKERYFEIWLYTFIELVHLPFISSHLHIFYARVRSSPGTRAACSLPASKRLVSRDRRCLSSKRENEDDDLFPRVLKGECFSRELLNEKKKKKLMKITT